MRFFRYKIFTILWALVIMVLTFTPGPNLPPLPHWELISFDTFVHTVIFGVLIFLLANTLKRLDSDSFLSKYQLLVALLLAFAYGVLIEVIQPYIPGRTFDYYDILSNTIGCFIGLIVLWIQTAFSRSFLTRSPGK